MKFFVKLNIVSVLYALMLFIAIELVVNVYRISRVTGWEFGTVNIVITIIYVIGFIFSTILFIRLTKKWMISRKASYWSLLLWFPYFILFVLIFTYLFPLSSGETLFPIFGLLIYGIILMYPIYILIINLYVASISIDGEEIRHT